MSMAECVGILRILQQCRFLVLASFQDVGRIVALDDADHNPNLIYLPHLETFLIHSMEALSTLFDLLKLFCLVELSINISLEENNYPELIPEWPHVHQQNLNPVLR